MTWKERQHSFRLSDRYNAALTGTVFDIQRFSVHDGNGIRTLVFLKGCPLHCMWCQNPESMSPKPELMRLPHLCIGCGKCIEKCPENVFSIDSEGAFIVERDKCTYCGECVAHCYAGAMTIVGRYMTVDDVMEEVERDRHFYETSGGGVTFSGGEPTMQAEFLLECLCEAHRRGLHTAIETCAMVRSDVFERILEHTDLVLTDIKHMDSAQHKRLTGASNELVLRNISNAAAMGKKLRIRVPLIPGCNDSVENIEATAKFVSSLGSNVESLDILPYHRLGEPKWEQLDRTYPLHGIEPNAKETVLAMHEVAQKYVESVTIGG
ncbi:glycyl-radical enzyme activating protein [Halodesulfovibrio sp.]|jgi:pyruvate formate lyase activating enzyme|uniref:glycyl-radical enzyme activating protein n=1 Tax=Halodesulfovibrio sp. TaxID=1912772 RepID=UPI0025CE08B1|nr:glycyl-radical enzyme activating protein [Halodesulfovibrio sp.]MCT4534180.1 glycyl-radical enzyme activating protein [Halodesulfovibrio sp.]